MSFDDICKLLPSNCVRKDLFTEPVGRWSTASV